MRKVLPLPQQQQQLTQLTQRLQGINLADRPRCCICTMLTSVATDDVEVAFCLLLIFKSWEIVAQPLTSADLEVSSLPGEIPVGC